MKKYFYFLFMTVGIILPYSQFVPWSMTGGRVQDIPQLAAVNPIAAGITLDALVAALFLIIFILVDRFQIKVKHAWLPILGIFIFGIAFAYPCYFYLRERGTSKL